MGGFFIHITGPFYKKSKQKSFPSWTLKNLVLLNTVVIIDVKTIMAIIVVMTTFSMIAVMVIMAATYTCIALFDIIIMIALMTMMAITKKEFIWWLLTRVLKG